MIQINAGAQRLASVDSNRRAARRAARNAMFTHLLLPTDGSTHSECAVRLGVRLAAALGARVTGFAMVHPHGGSAASLPVGEEETRLARARLRFIKEVANGHGVACEVVLVHGNDPAQSIVRAARELRCDLVVMGSHGRRGVQALVLGSETRKVLLDCGVPVLVCR